MEIGYVCTNYNNTKFTRDAVRTLLANQGHTIRIVIVDNDSAEASVQELRAIEQEFPGVKVIYNPENVGYFPGLNVGIAWLREHHPSVDTMVVGNNDLTFASGFVDSVVAQSARFAQYPVLSPDVITLDGVHQNPHVIRKISKIRELMYDLYFANYHLGQVIKYLARRFNAVSDRSDELSWEIGQPIYQGHGSVYLLGPKFFANFQLLWAPTFLMGEEFFLSKQLSDKGMQVYYEPGIQVTHIMNASIGQQPSRKIWEISRESHRMYRKYVKVID